MNTGAIAGGLGFRSGLRAHVRAARVAIFGGVSFVPLHEAPPEA
jgi:hypothetical protein